VTDERRENSVGSAALRVVGRPFAPGQSGNPRGRPKIDPDVRNLARRHAPDALAKLIALMSHPRPEIALRACEAVLDRAYGKVALVNESEPAPITAVHITVGRA
jgi:uncharacterized protein DUF5681